MTFLPDINVWLALAVDGHDHHDAAAAWLDSVEDDGIAFCRITEMGLLRLLTNQQVMSGAPLSPAKASAVRDAFLADSRVFFAAEPLNVHERWRRATRARQSGTNFWTDAYLTNFCTEAKFTLVTFDRALGRHPGTQLLRPLNP